MFCYIWSLHIQLHVNLYTVHIYLWQKLHKNNLTHFWRQISPQSIDVCMYSTHTEHWSDKCATVCFFLDLFSSSDSAEVLKDCNSGWVDKHRQTFICSLFNSTRSPSETDHLWRERETPNKILSEGKMMKRKDPQKKGQQRTADERERKIERELCDV